jgi:hypothetical protein
MPEISASTWKERYNKAVRESDPSKVHEAVLVAEVAMFKRGMELDGSADHHAERKEMEAASSDLLAIKIHKLGWPKLSNQAHQ